MKKLITFFTFILLLSSVGLSQDFRFGLTANPLLSWFRLDNSDLESDGVRAGINFGLIFEKGLGDEERYVFASGIFLTNLGGKIAVDSMNLSIKQTVKLQYIDIPLTVKLKANEANYMTWFGQIGLTPSFKIRSRGDLEVSPETTPPTSYENEKLEDINIFNLSLTIGAGMEYAISENTSLQGGLFFNNGFVNIVDDGDGDKITLHNIGLMLGVLF